MSETAKKDEAGGRWWEFYFIRYAMGTVVGGLLFFAISHSSPGATLSVLWQLPNDPSQLSAGHVALYLAYGLAYCYIASAPILVFHTGRFLMLGNRVSVLAATVAIVTVIAIYSLLVGLTNSSRTAVLAFVPVIVLMTEIYIIGRVLWSPNRMYKFYKELDERRSKSTGEIVTSYRHLREHGNSFSIVLCEIVFAMALLFAGNKFVVENTPSPEEYVTRLVAIVVVWILPAVLVWWAATRLEREFASD